jgi:hypothetical protein
MTDTHNRFWPITLAAAAALVNLPIREARMERPAPAAA